jgi:uncharacterized membrane protein
MMKVLAHKLRTYLSAGFIVAVLDTDRQFRVADAISSQAAAPAHHNLLALITASDYGCYFALFAIVCAYLTLAVYAFRRRYPDLHVWP